MSTTGTQLRAATAKPVAARSGLLFLAAAVLLALGMMASLGVGSNPIPPGRVWQLLWAPDGSFDAVVVLEQRLPRTLVLLVVGAALGVAGALMQSLTRNPLGSPDVIGFATGAYTGALVALTVVGAGAVSASAGWRPAARSLAPLETLLPSS